MNFFRKLKSEDEEIREEAPKSTQEVILSETNRKMTQPLKMTMEATGLELKDQIRLKEGSMHDYSFYLIQDVKSRSS